MLTGLQSLCRQDPALLVRVMSLLPLQCVSPSRDPHPHRTGPAPNWSLPCWPPPDPSCLLASPLPSLPLGPWSVTSVCEDGSS